MPPVGSRRGFACPEAGAGVGFRLGIDALTGLSFGEASSPMALKCRVVWTPALWRSMPSIQGSKVERAPKKALSLAAKGLNIW